MFKSTYEVDSILISFLAVEIKGITEKQSHLTTVIEPAVVDQGAEHKESKSNVSTQNRNTNFFLP